MRRTATATRDRICPDTPKPSTNPAPLHTMTERSRTDTPPTIPPCRPSTTPSSTHWVDAHFDEQVQFLQHLIHVPTDTPPGNNAPHARTRSRAAGRHGLGRRAAPGACRAGAGRRAAKHHQPGGAPPLRCRAARWRSMPTATWCRPARAGRTTPTAATIEGGKIYGRAAAVSKCDFSTYAFAVRALEAARPAAARARWSCCSPTTRNLAARWARPGCCAQGIIQPDLMIAAGFSYQVITAHNGCLQMEVTVHGKMAHAAIPDSGIDALQGAVHNLECAVRAKHAVPADHARRWQGISHPYLNVGRIEGGTNTNVVPGARHLQAGPPHDSRRKPGGGRSQHPRA